MFNAFLSHSGKLFANVNIYSFLHAALWLNQQGRNEGARGSNYPGADSLWERWNTAGVPNDCRGSKKSPKCHKYTTFASGRLQDRKLGRHICILSWAPSNLVTLLSVWRLVPSRNPSTHFYVAKLRCRQTADSRTALAISPETGFSFSF